MEHAVKLPASLAFQILKA